jgi:hypothetical protein
MGIGNHERPHKGKTDVWLTPLNITEALGSFDLDPCGEQFHKTAKTIYSSNGLESPWFGRVWLNPPYSEVEAWLDKLALHGNGVALVFARMDTRWAQKIVPMASEVFFPKGRIAFLTKDLKTVGKAGAPSMFLSFGDIPDWSKLGPGLVFHMKK